MSGINPSFRRHQLRQTRSNHSHVATRNSTGVGFIMKMVFGFGAFSMIAIAYLQIVTMRDVHGMAHMATNGEFVLDSKNFNSLDTGIGEVKSNVSSVKVGDKHDSKDGIEDSKENQSVGNDAEVDPNCSFREYVGRRYYGHPNNSKAVEPMPKFLTDSLYIRGENPIILIGQGVNNASKVCLDHSSWDKGIARGKRPFVDSQNPSVMSLRLGTQLKENKPRLDKKNVDVLVKKYGEESVNEMFIASVTVGNGQCNWGETAEEKENLRISDIDEAPTVHGELLILDENMNRLEQTSIKLLLDSKWGRMNKSNQKVLVELDDTRLFFYDGAIWLFYRNGKNLGYDKQAHSPLYLNRNEKGEIEAYIKASEMIPLCCGRNMSILTSDKHDQLQAITWIDPLTVEEFGPKKDITEHQAVESKPGRHLRQQKSNVHGTNGFMAHLHSTNEYLGIAHFHRPEGRGKNPYARHGHHYTHAFFAISDEKPYYLTRISNEFLFKSQSKQVGFEDDGDIIQFAGSIDLIGDDDITGELLISYGINDCEGATLTVDMDTVNTMLQSVPKNTEVITLMKKLEL